MMILTSEEMRNIDRRATERFGVPAIVLMENAAIVVADAIFSHYVEAERVSIFCGTGNNGGDGFALARHLENRGIVPAIFVIGARDEIKGDAAVNLRICERLGIPMYDVRNDASLDEALVHASDADLLVDAIFGTGLNRAPSGVHAETIRAMNGLALPIVAVDLPSGADASSANVFEPCVQAALTITFALPKHCHVFEPAALLCGEVVVADISIPVMAIDEENVLLSLTTPRDLRPYVEPRLASTHKGSYGHVGIIAGSPGRGGAAVLTARGAIRTGAGLVSVCTDADTARLVTAASVESMTHPVGLSAGTLDQIVEWTSAKKSVAIGPGLPDDEETYALVRELVARIDVPLVVDASALNAFAGRLAEINSKGKPRILTPHPGELGRLLGSDAATVNANRIELAREAARTSRCVVVLKGHHTLIAHPDGHVNVNPTGNPGMATGGMGDVLSGIIAALFARGIESFDAAITGTFLHGLAGDLLCEEHGDTGLAARDLAEHVPHAIQRLRASGGVA